MVLGLGVPIYINPIFLIVVFPIYYILLAFFLMRMAQMAGVKNSWMAWVPILNFYLLVQIAQKPAWWILLCFIPYAGILPLAYLWVLACFKTLDSAGKPRWWTVFLFLPIIQFIFLGILTAGVKPAAREEKLGNFCPQCGAEIKKAAVFCPSCGKKIVQERKALKKFCPRCGAEVEVSAKFCPDCGEALPEMKIEEEKSIKNFCPQCGAKLLSGANFCPKCGVKISEVEARVKGLKPEKPVREILREEKAERAPEKPSRGKAILMRLLWRIVIPFIVIFIIYLIFYLMAGVRY